MKYALNETNMHIVVIILMAMLILSNCAPRVIPGPVYLYPKVEPIDIELKNFSFQPNHIAILKHGASFPISFQLSNSAQTKHNFTLMDSHGNILVSIDVMPNKSTMVTIEPPDSGNYTFFCNRFLHRFFGMEGMLMVD
jgi:uncharacterized cupredoxin-like copper-binding protein